MPTVRVANSGETLQVGKIICVGSNYAEHVKEMKAEVPEKPLLFLKPPSALIRSGEDIVIPRISKEVHHEVEIVVLIGSGGKKIREDAAHECVFGYGVGLDMTLRDVQRAAKERGWPWAVAKGFDTSAPVSDIIPKERVASAAGLEIRCSVNGAQRQQGLASAMIFSVEKLVSYISALFTLERGDLIFTGTPQGVAKVEPGDLIEAELVGYAKTTHHVRNDE